MAYGYYDNILVNFLLQECGSNQFKDCEFGDDEGGGCEPYPSTRDCIDEDAPSA